MLTQFTVIYKSGNTIDTAEVSSYTLEEALGVFDSWLSVARPHYVLGVMPTEVFRLLPDASVFFGIFPY